MNDEMMNVSSDQRRGRESLSLCAADRTLWHSGGTSDACIIATRTASALLVVHVWVSEVY